MRNNLDAKCKYITGKICRERLKGNDGACPFRPVNSLWSWMHVSCMGGRGENSALASQNFIHLKQSYIRCCNVSSVNGNLFHTASIVCNEIGDKFGSKPNLKSPQLHQNAIQ